MTIRQIRSLVPYWVDTLNLHEWTITVRWGTKQEMAADVNSDEGYAGWNYYSAEEALSEILLHRQDHAHEHTLVHELLHLVFDGHKGPSSKYDRMHERAINKTATALITLARMDERYRCLAKHLPKISA